MKICYTAAPQWGGFFIYCPYQLVHLHICLQFVIAPVNKIFLFNLRLQPVKTKLHRQHTAESYPGFNTRITN